MPRSGSLAFAFSLAATLLAATDQAPVFENQALWREFGLVHADSGKHGKLIYTAYRMKDLTGALAAWEWQRTPEGKQCDQAAFCTRDGNRTVVFEDNYLVSFTGPRVTKVDVNAVLRSLPEKRDSSLPAILTFLPAQGLVPNSAKYVLGETSLVSFSPELASSKPGFSEGAEGQVAEYRLGPKEAPIRLAIFYYPTPEMARLHTVGFKRVPGTRVKRSGVLVAVVSGGATEQQADTLLSRIQYQAKITWNDPPPPGPIKPLYALLLNILYMSGLLTALCLMGGLIYGAMRIYRRRYGNLEADEAMTTLHLRGD